MLHMHAQTHTHKITQIQTDGHTSKQSRMDMHSNTSRKFQEASSSCPQTYSHPIKSPFTIKLFPMWIFKQFVVANRMAAIEKPFCWEFKTNKQNPELQNRQYICSMSEKSIRVSYHKHKNTTIPQGWFSPVQATNVTMIPTHTI